MGNTLRNLSSGQSPAPSGWTTCSARATKRPSLTALISLWIIVAHMRAQASSAQIPVCHKYLEQEPELCLVDFNLQNFKFKSQALQGVAVQPSELQLHNFVASELCPACQVLKNNQTPVSEFNPKFPHIAS